MKTDTVRLPRIPQDSRVQSRYRGCLLGGAVGDALGAPIEFMSGAQILRAFGPGGIQEFVPAFGKLGAITDDTQMTLFTAEGLMRAMVRSQLKGICDPAGVMAFAYLRWLHTQGGKHFLQEGRLNGWLIGQPELFARRAPGLTCLSALASMRSGSDAAINTSKGCGAVMRVAPVGMYFASLCEGRTNGALDHEAFDFAVKAAAITHGHPTGQLASGVFALIILKLLQGEPLLAAVEVTRVALMRKPEHEETLGAIDAALEAAANRPNSPAVLETLGGGWVAEEALAIALYCALGSDDLRSGVQLAVNHGGDSDSTGSMAGQLLGAIHGVESIPASWLAPLELRDVIAAVADDLATVCAWRLGEEDAGEGDEEEAFYFRRYPGG